MRLALLCLLLFGVGCSQEAAVPSGRPPGTDPVASAPAALLETSPHAAPPAAAAVVNGWSRQQSPAPLHAQRGAPDAAGIRPLRPPPD